MSEESYLQDFWKVSFLISLFSDFQYDFRSSRSTVDHLTVLSHKIAWTFSGSNATQTVALDICKLFDQS